MPSQKFIYLCLDGGSHVIESQVVDLLAALHEHDRSLDINLIMLGRRSDVAARKPPLFDEQRHSEIAQRIGGRFIVRTFVNGVSGVFKTLFLLFRHTFPDCFSRRLVITGRSKDGAFLGAMFKLLCFGRPRLIYDQRGDIVAEYIYSKERIIASELSMPHKLMLKTIRFMEWFGLRVSDRILYVTDHLRSVIQDRYPFAAAKEADVFPCLADEEKMKWSAEDRSRIRAGLGLNDQHVVLTYGGSLKRYQCVNEMMALFSEMRRRNDSTYFLFLTERSQHNQVRDRLKSIAPESSWSVREAGHDEMSGYLSAGDFGLLLREESPVNRSAAPTKFAEYVMSGLPVVLTDGIGDYGRLAGDNNWGVVCSNLLTMDEAALRCLDWHERNKGEQTHQRIADQSKVMLSRQSQIARYAAFVAGASSDSKAS